MTSRIEQRDSGTMAHPAVEQILSRVPLIVWTTDRDLKVTWIRGGAIRMLGIDQHCSEGTAINDVFEIVDGSIADRHTQALEGEPHSSEILWRNRSLHICIEPLRDNRGAIIGTIGIARDATDEKRATDALMLQGFRDPLTGALTRTRFLEQASVNLLHAGRSGSELTFLYIDVDGFGTINDSFGSAIADEVLREVAARLRAFFPFPDIVGRMGSDEFAIVTGRTGPKTVAAMCAALQKDLNVPMFLYNKELSISVSIGSAAFPLDGASVEHAVRGASTASGIANALGGAQSKAFSPAMKIRTMERMQIDQDLRRALQRDEFFLVFQPQVNIADGSLIGVEVLLRWRKDGDVLPAWTFIRQAEESVLMIPITEWVIDQSVQQLKVWQETGLDPGRIAINIGARQLDNDSILTSIGNALAKYGVDGHSLEVEITETAAMQNYETTGHLIEELRALGVQITIDDFGTGYSSLSYLKRFAITGLKIDRSFTTDLPDSQTASAIVAAIISTAHALGVRVVAEGVENQAQAEHLLTAGCLEAQGFLFARPLTAEAMTEYLHQSRANALAAI